MDDNELDNISRDPRFSGKLKKRTKKEKEDFKKLFEGLEEEETYKDMRGRPWPRRPLKYAKQLLDKEKSTNLLDDGSESAFLNESGSESSSSTSKTRNENLADLQDTDWYELVKNSKIVKDSSRRLSVLHFDWDNCNAETIFLALESFLPPRACLEKVTIYPSEYGMRKMAEDEKHGPREIWMDSEDENGSNQELAKNMSTDEKKDWNITSVRMKRRFRRYQLQRLKYFYAIAEFDSKESAAAVYEACDGVEYACTGIRFDLRFVSDEETFTVPSEWSHLINECCEVNRAKYKPQVFENNALHSTRISLSWDCTSGARTQWLREQFEAKAEPHKLFSEGRAQLSQYLALSSSGQSTAAPSDVEELDPAPTVPRIRRHRPPKIPPEQLRAALLSAILDDSASTAQKSQLNNKNVGDDESEREELVTDFNALDEEEEEYDLTAIDDDPHRDSGKHTVLNASNGLKAITKRRAPEVMTSDSDSYLDFDDIEDRVSDTSDENASRTLRRGQRQAYDNSDDDKISSSEHAKKKKKKLDMRKKAQLKKKKQERNQEKVKELWTGDNEADSRFDVFLTDPMFGVSQLNRDYREAYEFLNFMRRRRGPLLKAQMKAIEKLEDL